MLDFMRKKKESIIIKFVFVVIVLSFIGTIFLVWGKGSDGFGGRNPGYAAKVNGSKISLEEYQTSYQNLRNIYQQIYGQPVSPEMEKALGLKRLALDSLIDNLLIRKEAASLGVKVSKEDVASAIEAMPTFQKGGRFDFDLYRQILRSSRITPKDFEAAQKNELILAKARQAIKDKATVSDGDALARYRLENDKLDLEYVSYAPADVIGEVKLTDAELNDYLQKNPNDFKTPEKVALSYILIDPSTQVSKLTVSEDEIQTYYQKNIDRWQNRGNILPLAEVKDKVRAEALRQKAAKQAYELAADTLYKNIKSGDLKPIAAALNLKIQETGLFEAATPPASLAGEAAVVKKALELKQGELGGPVETAKGIYILRVKERTASAVPPLQAIRAAVEQKAKAAKAAELAGRKAAEAARQLAAKAALKTASTGLFGYSAAGVIPNIGTAPAIMEAAFKLTPAAPAPAEPFKLGNRWYAIRLRQRVEAPKAEFDKIKEQLKLRMLPKKQEEALASWIKELRNKAKIEYNQTLVAEK